MDFRRRIVIPAHRHFHDFLPLSLDQEQQFRIKSEAFCRLQLKGSPRRFAAKELKAALGVAKSQPGEESDYKVEKASAELPEPGLVNADQLPLQRSRAHGSIRPGSF